MPKKLVDPKSGAVIFKSTPEEKDTQRLKKRIISLEKRVEELEILIRQLMEVTPNE